ncbi:MAG: 3-phosphoshikimate 1-carboxyvinyltransferase [Ferrimicrobium sp.]|jgi:3-phosphoshikimate 1-carboxyvinyltransferase|nr:3-phosphoshikimate 1-carboxyvinyltransferase [Ferrimicrobium sp.]
MLARITSIDPSFAGTLVPPPDKSISHRALLFSLLAEGTSRLAHLSGADDVAATARMIEQFGASIVADGAETLVQSPGLFHLAEPTEVIDLANSGTGVRLGIGVATLAPGMTVFTGDASLRERPMARVLAPLQRLGASIWGRGEGTRLPVAVHASKLHGGTIELNVASAQVKSAVLLAGLGIDGQVSVIEPSLSRPHTEEFLCRCDVPFDEIVADDGSHTVSIAGPTRPSPLHYRIPSDPSAAAFFLVGAAVTPGSSVHVDDTYLGPTRTGFLDVLASMGAHIERVNDQSLTVVGASLVGTRVGGSMVTSLIDEIPILCVGAALADGVTVFDDVGELRVKESDRIETTAEALRAFGVRVETLAEGLIVHGGLRPGSLVRQHRRVVAHFDHRIAMSAAVLGVIAGGVTDIDGVETVASSYPGFFTDLGQLTSATVELIDEET